MHILDTGDGADTGGAGEAGGRGASDMNEVPGWGEANNGCVVELNGSGVDVGGEKGDGSEVEGDYWESESEVLCCDVCSF